MTNLFARVSWTFSAPCLHVENAYAPGFLGGFGPSTSSESASSLKGLSEQIAQQTLPVRTLSISLLSFFLGSRFSGLLCV